MFWKKKPVKVEEPEKDFFNVKLNNTLLNEWVRQPGCLELITILERLKSVVAKQNASENADIAKTSLYRGEYKAIENLLATLKDIRNSEAKNG